MDGGLSKSEYLMNFQANVLNVNVAKNNNSELTAYGAALMAALASGFWSNLDQFSKNQSQIYAPNINEHKRQKLIQGWHHAVNKTLGWNKDVNS